MSKAVFNINNKIKAPVLGATGLAGQRFVKTLAGHPWFKLTALTASARSAGKTYGTAVSWALSGDVPRVASEMELLSTSAKQLAEL